MKIIKKFPLLLLLVLDVFWLLFSLFSGVPAGGGLKGIMSNTPNTLPWLILLVAILIAWRFRLIGGILIFLLGVASAFFFDVFKAPVVFFFVSLPLLVFGSWLFIASLRARAEISNR
jgi:hypothetical protein